MFKFFKKKPNSSSKGSVKRIKTPEKVQQLEEDFKNIPWSRTMPRAKEQIWRGPRNQFSEDINLNLKLIAKGLPDSNLTFIHFKIGSRSQTEVVVAYLKDKANPQIVEEIISRLESIQAEIVPDSSYIERNIEDSAYSPFPQLAFTPRPDMVELGLGRGQVAIFVDNSPDVLLAPTTFFDLISTPDDYYRRWFIGSSFFRIARYLVLLIATFLPSFYIALTSFNPELIPTTLVFMIAASREGNPFPIYLEAFLMMGVVEAVRMVNLRMPATSGQTVGIFGGLTLAIAGLWANFISPAIIIIVTLTIIASFALPNFDLRSSLRIIQFFTMLMATLFGLLGLAVAFFYICIHLATLKSFGISYMAPLAPLEASGWGHSLLRENTLQMPIDKTYKPLGKKAGGDPYE